jgi:hypothetical protein
MGATIGSGCGLAACMIGDERYERSISSTPGDGFLIAVGCEDRRSRVSTPGDTDFVFRNRGDVRRLRADVEPVFEFFLFSETDVAEEAEMDDALDDIEVKGGRAVNVMAVRRAFVVGSNGDIG